MWRVPLASPYCATGTSSGLEYFHLLPATRGGRAKKFLENEGVSAKDVFYGKTSLPDTPYVAVFTRKGGGHVGFLWRLAQGVMKLWEPNTSPDKGVGSQWNGSYTGWRTRSVKAACSPWNAFRIVKFVPVQEQPLTYQQNRVARTDALRRFEVISHILTFGSEVRRGIEGVRAGFWSWVGVGEVT